MGAEVGEIGPLQRPGMGRLQDDLWRNAGLERLGPTRRAQAPPVAGAEPGKPELGPRGSEVVADRRAELEELGGDEHTHGVHPHVLGARVAAAVAVEAGERIHRAGLELAAENVLRHGVSLPRDEGGAGAVGTDGGRPIPARAP